MRSSVSLALPVAATLIVGILTACATADDGGVLAQEQDQTAEKVTIPTDAGGSTSSSSTSSTSSTSSSSSTSSGSSGVDASTSSSGSTTSSGGTAGVCDTSDPIKTAIWFIEIGDQSSPVPCPCGTGKCCYLGVTCVTDL